MSRSRVKIRAWSRVWISPLVLSSIEFHSTSVVCSGTARAVRGHSGQAAGPRQVSAGWRRELGKLPVTSGQRRELRGSRLDDAEQRGVEVEDLGEDERDGGRIGADLALWERQRFPRESKIGRVFR